MGAHAAAAEFLIGPRAGLLALVVLVGVVLVATDKHGTVARWPFKVAWAGLRLAGFRPAHLPWLLATVVLVFQAAPIAGWRVPLLLATVGWLTWVWRPGRGRGPRWLRRAERRYANALQEATRNLHRTTATKTQPTPTRPVRRPTSRPTRTNRPAPARPAAQPDPATAKPRRSGPGTANSGPSAPSWSPPPPPRLEPVWPRWLGGGRWHKPKGD